MSAGRRKNMLKKLNVFFAKQDKVLTELEYKNAPGTPIRSVLIRKYFNGYDRMVNSLYRYYPQWADIASEEVRRVERQTERTKIAAAKAEGLRRQAEKVQEEDGQSF